MVTIIDRIVRGVYCVVGVGNGELETKNQEFGIRNLEGRRELIIEFLTLTASRVGWWCDFHCTLTDHALNICKKTGLMLTHQKH
jgi:hypothetical protein